MGVADYLKVRKTRRGELRGRWRVGSEAGVFGSAQIKSDREHSLIERLVARRLTKRLKRLGLMREGLGPIPGER